MRITELLDYNDYFAQSSEDLMNVIEKFDLRSIEIWKEITTFEDLEERIIELLDFIGVEPINTSGGEFSEYYRLDVELEEKELSFYSMVDYITVDFAHATALVNENNLLNNKSIVVASIDVEMQSSARIVIFPKKQYEILKLNRLPGVENFPIPLLNLSIDLAGEYDILELTLNDDLPQNKIKAKLIELIKSSSHPLNEMIKHEHQIELVVGSSPRFISYYLDDRFMGVFNYVNGRYCDRNALRVPLIFYCISKLVDCTFCIRNKPQFKSQEIFESLEREVLTKLGLM